MVENVYSGARLDTTEMYSTSGGCQVELRGGRE